MLPPSGKLGKLDSMGQLGQLGQPGQLDDVDSNEDELTGDEAAAYTPERIFAKKTGSEAFRDDWLPAVASAGKE